MKLEAPEIVRKGSAYGVKLKAGAPSIHMLRVDLDTEISPMVGDEKQSQDLVNSLSEQYQSAPDQLWRATFSASRFMRWSTTASPPSFAGCRTMSG